VYAYVVQSGPLELGNPNAADAYYNILVRGFRAGQLSLKKEVPPGFAQLADPYDPTATAPYQALPYRLLDLSYYKGRLYLYFGATPALILFWPFAALTGHYLFHRQAVVIFCAIGFLASVGLLRALWQRYFTEVSLGVVVACAVALGLATGVPVLLSRSDVWEVPISCGYMLTMLALGAIWCALHDTEQRCRWLMAASAAYGLAVGARPSLLFGAIILLVPVAQARREGRQMGASLLAAIVPIVLIGSGLMLYNALRFDNPLEFGMRYQLTDKRQIARQFFSLHHLWFNFRVYFLEPVRWRAHPPFVKGIVMPPAPPGHGNVEHPFGVVTNIPLVWLALAVPLAWRDRSEQAGWVLRWFVTAVALLFGIGALTLGFYYCTASRLEVEFLPALLLLAVVGILGLERSPAGRPIWRRAVRWGWSLLLGFSVAFNLLACVGRCAEAHYNLGTVLFQQSQVPEAIAHYEQALRLNPDYADAHNDLGLALVRPGRLQEAMGHWEQALRIKPDYPEAHNNMGNVFWHEGKFSDAVGHYEQALRSKPDYAEPHNSLGVVLKDQGKVPEAIAHYEQALRLNPDYAEAHINLGVALARLGRMQEAAGHWEQALRSKPDDAKGHYNLGVVLAQLGRMQEAIGHYEQALRSKPDYAAAHNSLGVALEMVGKTHEALEHFEQALRLEPDRADVHYNLGGALEMAGKNEEAIVQYERALRLKPDFAKARNALARLQAAQ
jgi:Tfp pilus assembly protein PilF